MNTKKITTLLLCSVIVFMTIAIPTYSDELDDINAQLTKLQRDLEESKKATEPLEKNLTGLTQQLNQIKTSIDNLEIEIARKELEVKEGERALIVQKQLLDKRVLSHYKNVKKSELTFLTLITADNLSSSLQNFFYQKTLADQDKQSIIKIVHYISNLEQKKATLLSERTRVSETKKLVDDQSAFLAEEITKARTYQSDLSGQIASLTARQQSIITARSGSFTVNIGDSEQADDQNASIAGFRASASGGYFGVFSFGAHTHRKGMSQYGARGRAQSGQNYRDILKAYYGKEPEDRDTGGDISVAGHGSMNFEEQYLMGIAEMPSSWHHEALKAQAVAARTYAYRYKQEGKEICTTEACQVYNSGKAAGPPQSWKDAVQSTRGLVLDGVVTFYASTHGGFASPIGWDTTDGSGGGNFIDKSYDKAGGSPWLYKAWYTQHYSINSDKCGRSNAWLSPEEMADIVNAAIVMTKSSDNSEVERITPVTTSCWGGNPYSMSELREVAGKYGGISSATSVSVSQGNGSTNTVTINGITLSGDAFKKAFNVRAPGYLAIPQRSFSFFNIEKK